MVNCKGRCFVQSFSVFLIAQNTLTARFVDRLTGKGYLYFEISGNEEETSINYVLAH